MYRKKLQQLRKWRENYENHWYLQSKVKRIEVKIACMKWNLHILLCFSMHFTRMFIHLFEVIGLEVLNTLWGTNKFKVHFSPKYCLPINYRIRFNATPGFYFSKLVFGWGSIQIWRTWGCIRDGVLLFKWTKLMFV